MAKTILLADDSVTIQKVVGITFANEDVELVTVDNGDDALIRAREIKPDVILADVSMPGLDGYALCAAIRAEPEIAGIPLLLLTGAFKTFDEGRAQSVGVNAYIAKPFEAQALVDQVQQLLDQPSAPAAAPPAAVDFDDAPPEIQRATEPPDVSLDIAFGPADLDAAFGESDETRIIGATEIASNSDSSSTTTPVDFGSTIQSFHDPESTEPITQPSITFADRNEDALYGETSLLEPEPAPAPPDSLHHDNPAFQNVLDVGPPDDDTETAMPFVSSVFDEDSTETQPVHDELPELTEEFIVEHNPGTTEAPILDAETQIEDPFDAGPATMHLEPLESDARTTSPELDAVVERSTQGYSDVDPSAGAIDPATVHRALEKMAWEAFGSISEQLVQDVVQKVEAIAWEVIPQLAERLIREEIERIKSNPPQ